MRVLRVCNCVKCGVVLNSKITTPCTKVIDGKQIKLAGFGGFKTVKIGGMYHQRPYCKKCYMNKPIPTYGVTKGKVVEGITPQKLNIDS